MVRTAGANSRSPALRAVTVRVSSVRNWFDISIKTVGQPERYLLGLARTKLYTVKAHSASLANCSYQMFGRGRTRCDSHLGVRAEPHWSSSFRHPPDKHDPQPLSDLPQPVGVGLAQGRPDEHINVGCDLLGRRSDGW